MEFIIYMFVGLFFILGILSLYFCALKIFTKLLAKFKKESKQHIQTTSMIENKIEIVPQTYDEKLSALDELFKRSIDYKKSDTYKEALAFVIKLRNVAPFNAWLLGGQNPDITHVATANDWAFKFNRSIQPKARAYIILKQFGPVDFVYDVADTDGAELPKDLQAHFRAEGYLNTDFVANILHCCQKKAL